MILRVLLHVLHVFPGPNTQEITPSCGLAGGEGCNLQGFEGVVGGVNKGRGVVFEIAEDWSSKGMKGRKPMVRAAGAAEGGV